jgi:hypothetical protein
MNYILKTVHIFLAQIWHTQPQITGENRNRREQVRL